MSTATTTGIDTDALFSLTAADISQTRPLVVARMRALQEEQGRKQASIFFARVDIIDPLKSDVATLAAIRAYHRRTRAQVFDRGSKQVYEVLVDLTANAVTACNHVAGAKPNIPFEEFFEFEDVCRGSPAVRAAIEARGVKDFDPALVMVDPISSGHYDIPGEEDLRLSTGFAYYLDHKLDNGYAHPVPGLGITVNLDTLTIHKLHDYDPEGKIPIPGANESLYGGTLSQWYSPLLSQQPRMPDAKPLEIVQKDGPTFTLGGATGRHLQWLEWDMDIGFTYREGITLHNIKYRDPNTAEQRPICYRASVAEMAVPYATPAWERHRQNPIDSGEYGLGGLANPLTNGCDCLGEIRYLDVVVNDRDGNPRPIPNAICIHEEDAGLLWKHFDFRTDKDEVRRKRILVLSFICTVGNYEYAFYWKFCRDGSFELEVKLTGIINTDAKHSGNEKYGTEVTQGVLGGIHSHFFCARLDMNIDGPRNRVTELDYVAEEVTGPDGCNPYGNAIYVRRNELRSEKQAARKTDGRAERTWVVASSTRQNAMGKPTGYKLMPKSHVLPLQSPGSYIRKRLAFLDNHLWVTPYDPEQRHPATEFPNQATGPLGLPVWTQADRSVWDEDLVLWHNFGVHHAPRIEDWPCMNCVSTGFAMEPYGFFDKNPAMLLPKPTSKPNHCASAAADAAAGDCCPKSKL